MAQGEGRKKNHRIASNPKGVDYDKADAGESLLSDIAVRGIRRNVLDGGPGRLRIFQGRKLD